MGANERDVETGGAYEVEPRVLVAVVNNPRDLSIARDQGWYRIPVSRAPGRVAADYLAFYLTGAFGGDGHAVRYFAPVRGYRLTTRAQLFPLEVDHPRANEPYYRIDIDPLRELPAPIPSARLRRVTFIPTTLSRLLSAREINELWEERISADKLWAALRERGISSDRSVTIHDGREAYHADLVVPCREGAVAVLIETAAPSGLPGWLVLSFPEARLVGELGACVDEVCAAVEERGGIQAV
jgi:hypothetical protein